MEFRFADKCIERVYTEGRSARAARRYPPEVVKLFFRRIASIDAALTEMDLYQLKGARLEKLKTKPGIYSMRLNDQWRLELNFEETPEGRVVIIRDISKHYGD